MIKLEQCNNQFRTLCLNLTGIKSCTEKRNFQIHKDPVEKKTPNVLRTFKNLKISVSEQSCRELILKPDEKCLKPAVVLLAPTATLIVQKKMGKEWRILPKAAEAGSLAEQGLKRKGRAVSSIRDAKLIQIQFERFAAFKKASLVWFERPGAADSQGQLSRCYDWESDFSQEPGKHLDWDFPQDAQDGCLKSCKTIYRTSLYLFFSAADANRCQPTTFAYATDSSRQEPALGASQHETQ